MMNQINPLRKILPGTIMNISFNIIISSHHIRSEPDSSNPGMVTVFSWAKPISGSQIVRGYFNYQSLNFKESIEYSAKDAISKWNAARRWLKNLCAMPAKSPHPVKKIRPFAPGQGLRACRAKASINKAWRAPGPKYRQCCASRNTGNSDYSDK
ncbi:MAG: hypothetical protein ACLFV1_05635 [Thiohalophilus sp.]